MTVERLTIPSGPFKLAAALHLPPGEGPHAVVVACHGLLSSKASRKYIQLAEMAVASGMALVRFDFRSMGSSTGGPEALTLSGRLEDARSVLDFVRSSPWLDASRLALMGSSLGGVVAWATALAEPSVGATAVWASPADLTGLLASRGEPRPCGIARLPEAFYDDLEGHPLLKLPAGLSRVLILHGEDDEVVPLSHARSLYELALEPKGLTILPGADHRLTKAADRLRAAEETIRWFADLLGVGG